MTRYRRTAHLVCYWEKDQFILHNYATGIRTPATPLAVEILELCEDWRPASALVGDLRALDSTVLDTVLSALVEYSFLERSDRAVPVTSQLYSKWNGWRPAAAFFHATTKDMRYADAASVDALLRQKSVGGDPPPSPLKPAPEDGGGETIALTPPIIGAATAAPGDLQHALRARRTWRQFGAAAISRDQLATLLGLTWGVQQWMHVDGFNWMPLKTSPSGGARHSIEAYVYARHVTGLRRGWYHYDPDSHALRGVAVREGRGRHRKISAYLPTQHWYDGAAVLIAMTAIFERAQWRYGYARAYRSILAEAGHLAQTFCLLATSLDLAPFCSMALADSVIERDIGVDGVSESVVYASGVGHKPDGIDWAPWPNTTRTPRVKPPAWKRAGATASERPAATRSSVDRAARTAARGRRAPRD